MSFTPNIDCISFSISRIEECIKNIEAWMLINRHKLNGDKTEMLIIGTNKQCRKLSNRSINVGGSVIEASEKARNLGAVFDTNLTLKSHVNALCKSARYHLHNISLARRYLTKEAAEMLFTPLSCQDLTVTILCYMDYHHANYKSYRRSRMLRQEY